MPRTDLALPRRAVLLGVASVALTACVARSREGSATPSAPAAPSSVTDDPDLARIEATVGGRVGVFALDTGSGRTLAHRADERFAMCSTFKWILAAAALARVDRGQAALDERIAYGPADVAPFEDTARVTRLHLAEGAMTLEALAHAAVTVSDNAAANLLLARLDGPAGLTAFIRASGDAITRLDRNEGTLNTNEPGDPRDTTSPRAMVGLMNAVLLGHVLSPASTERLRASLRACETGTRRLRAGLPAGWDVGDKTGTGENGAFNDLAIAVPPGRAPLLLAVYTSEGPDDEDARRHEAAMQAIARLAAGRLAG